MEETPVKYRETPSAFRTPGTHLRMGDGTPGITPGMNMVTTEKKRPREPESVKEEDVPPTKQARQEPIKSLQMVLRLVIPQSWAGVVIGKGGQTLARIRQDTGVFGKMSTPVAVISDRLFFLCNTEDPSSESCPIAEAFSKVIDTIADHERLERSRSQGRSSRGGGGAGGADGSGSQASAAPASQNPSGAASSQTGHRSPLNALGHSTALLLVEAQQVGAVLGPKGSRIQKIRKDTGCRVQVCDERQPLPLIALQNDRLMILQGTTESVKAAGEQVIRILRANPPKARPIPTPPIRVNSTDMLRKVQQLQAFLKGEGPPPSAEEISTAAQQQQHNNQPGPPGMSHPVDPSSAPIAPPTPFDAGFMASMNMQGAFGGAMMQMVAQAAAAQQSLMGGVQGPLSAMLSAMQGGGGGGGGNPIAPGPFPGPGMMMGQHMPQPPGPGPMPPMPQVPAPQPPPPFPPPGGPRMGPPPPMPPPPQHTQHMQQGPYGQQHMPPPPGPKPPPGPSPGMGRHDGDGANWQPQPPMMPPGGGAPFPGVGGYDGGFVGGRGPAPGPSPGPGRPGPGGYPHAPPPPQESPNTAARREYEQFWGNTASPQQRQPPGGFYRHF